MGRLALCANLVLIILTACLPPPGESFARSHSTQKKNILFVLDASGSMSVSFGGETRMAAARRMLLRKLASIKPRVPVGLVAYGNRIKGCNSARIYAPIATGNRPRMIRIIGRMYPSGNTPLALTLRMIRKRIMPRFPNTSIIVISDGAENCQGNPILEAALLRKRGADIHIIGMSVSRHTARELDAVARAGNGNYFHVRNRRDLEDAIRNTTRPTGRAHLLVDHRTRRNLYLERKWGLDDDNRLIAGRSRRRIGRSVIARRELRRNANVSAAHALVITKVEKGKPRGGRTVITVYFRFSQPRRGNYHVSIHALPLRQRSGPHARLRAGSLLMGISGITYYNVSAHRGKMKLEIPSAILARQPIYLQGELWNTTEVPTSAYVSNSMSLR